MSAALATPAPARVLRLSELVDPNEKQREFLVAARKYRYTLYGGAAGGGKSYILRWWLLIFLIEAYARYSLRNVRVGLFCEDYNSLRDRQVSRIKHEFPKEFGDVTSSKDEGLVYMLRPELGGGFISLRNLDDPSKYQSVEFAAIGIDELTRNPEAVFHALRMRLRWPGFPDGFVFPFGAATNPGSIGHAWVKRYWVTRDFPEVLNPADFTRIKALAADNPKLPRDYEATQLASIVDPQTRKAFKDGDWDLFAGQFFSEWRHELHTYDPRTVALPAWWRRFRATDWGFDAPWATGWFAVDPDGGVWMYRELYQRCWDNDKYARRVVELSQGEAIDYSVMDPSCWDSSADSRKKSIAEQCAEAGWACQKASNNRKNGWSQVRAFLAWQRNEAADLVRQPRLRVSTDCVHTLRTVPSLPYDRVNSEDLDTKSEDHAADMLRYALMSRPPLTVEPIETMTIEEAEAVMRLQHATKPGGAAAWPGAY